MKHKIKIAVLNQQSIFLNEWLGVHCVLTDMKNESIKVFGTNYSHVESTNRKIILHNIAPLTLTDKIVTSDNYSK